MDRWEFESKNANVLEYSVGSGHAGFVASPRRETRVRVDVDAGYGLTETCGMTTITTPDFWQIGSVGTLGPSCELKLAGRSYSQRRIQNLTRFRSTRAGLCDIHSSTTG